MLILNEYLVKTISFSRFDPVHVHPVSLITCDHHQCPDRNWDHILRLCHGSQRLRVAKGLSVSLAFQFFPYDFQKFS